VAVLVLERGQYALTGPAELSRRFGSASELRIAQHVNLVVICAD
jgi:hypothetical protein